MLSVLESIREKILFSVSNKLFLLIYSKLIFYLHKTFQAGTIHFKLLVHCLLHLVWFGLVFWGIHCICMYFQNLKENKLSRAFKSSSKSEMNYPFPCPSVSLGPKGQLSTLYPAQLGRCASERLPKIGALLLVVVAKQYFLLLGYTNKERYRTWRPVKKHDN